MSSMKRTVYVGMPASVAKLATVVTPFHVPCTSSHPRGPVYPFRPLRPVGPRSLQWFGCGRWSGAVVDTWRRRRVWRRDHPPTIHPRIHRHWNGGISSGGGSGQTRSGGQNRSGGSSQKRSGGDEWWPPSKVVGRPQYWPWVVGNLKGWVVSTHIFLQYIFP